MRVRSASITSRTSSEKRSRSGTASSGSGRIGGSSAELLQLDLRREPRLRLLFALAPVEHAAHVALVGQRQHFLGLDELLLLLLADVMQIQLLCPAETRQPAAGHEVARSQVGEKIIEFLV